MFDNPLDELPAMPGAAADVERNRLENPPRPYEFPADTDARLVNEAVVQQRVQQNVSRLKGIDLTRRRIPSYSDQSGNVQPVTDETGTPLTNYDRRHNVAYNSAGAPVSVNYDAEGAPAVEDAFAGIPTTVDPKTGAKYQIHPGLPWNYQGQDPEATAAALEKEKEKQVTELSTRLGRMLTLDERQQKRDEVDYGHRAKLISEKFGLNGDEDFPAIKAKVDEHFNNDVDGYASKDANRTAGWMPGGPLSEQAARRRAQIDAEKAAALQQVDALSTAAATLKARKEHIVAQQGIREDLQRRLIEGQLRRSGDLGLNLPSTGTSATPAPETRDSSAAEQGVHTAQVAGSSPAPATPEPPLYQEKDGHILMSGEKPYDAMMQAAQDGKIELPPVEKITAARLDQQNVQQSIADHEANIQAARDGKKPYGIDAAGKFKIDEAKPVASLEQAVADKIIDPPPPEVLKAAKEKQKLIDSAGSFPEMKAALMGFGRGMTFAATAPIGSGLGAVAGTEGGPIGMAAGGLIGGLVTGEMGAHVYSKAVEELGKHSSIIDSFVASQKLHPYYSGAGEMAAFGAGLPRAAMKAVGGAIGKGANALAGSSAVEGSTVDAIRATQAQIEVEMAAARTSGIKMAATVNRDVYSVAAKALDGVANAYAEGGGGALRTIEGLSDLAKGASDQALKAGLNPVVAASKQVAARVAIAAGGMAAIDTAIKEGSFGLGISDEHQSLGGLGMAAILGALTAGHGVTAEKYTHDELADIMTRGWAHDFGMTPETAKAMGLPETAGERMVAAGKTDPLTPEEREIYSTVNQEAMKRVDDGTISPDPRTWQMKAAQILVAGRKTGISSADIEGGGTGTKTAKGKVVDPASPEPAPAAAPAPATKPKSATVRAAENIAKGKATAAPAPATTAATAPSPAVAPGTPAPAAGDAQSPATAPSASGTPLPSAGDGSQAAAQTPARPAASTPQGSPGVPHQSGGSAANPPSATAAPVRTPASAAASTPQSTTGTPTQTGSGPSAGAEAGSSSTVDAPAHGAATSPKNDLPQPTQPQKEAGNYKVGRVKLGGMDISIENPTGSVRSGVDREGKAWQTEMKSHYGYIRGSKGKDGDHIDTFIKPGTPEDYSGPVYVVNQNHADGTFDEHKSIIGANSTEEAKQLYLENYKKGQEHRIHSIADFSNMALFKEWAQGASRRTAPARSSRTPEDTAKIVQENRISGLVWQARATLMVNKDSLESGKHPNGKKLTVADREKAKAEMEAARQVLEQYPEVLAKQEAQKKAHENSATPATKPPAEVQGGKASPAQSPESGAAQPGNQSVDAGQRPAAESGPHTSESVRKHVAEVVAAKAGQEAGLVVRSHTDTDAKMPDGLGIDPATKDIMVDHESLAREANHVEAHGGDGRAWTAAAVDEELAHHRDLLVSGHDFDNIHAALWKVTPEPVRAALKAVYPETQNPAHLAAELVRVIDQLRRRAPVTESLTESAPQAEALEAAIDAWDFPQELSNHLLKMSGLGGETPAAPAKSPGDRGLLERKAIQGMTDAQIADRLGALRVFMRDKMESGDAASPHAAENVARLYAEAKKRGLVEAVPEIDDYIKKQEPPVGSVIRPEERAELKRQGTHILGEGDQLPNGPTYIAFQLSDGTVLYRKAAAHFDLLASVPESLMDRITGGGFVENGKFFKGGDMGEGMKPGETAEDYWPGYREEVRKRDAESAANHPAASPKDTGGISAELSQKLDDFFGSLGAGSPLGKGQPPPPKSPLASDQERALQNAYRDLARTSGFPAVSIGQLASKASLPVALAKEQMLYLHQTGKAVLSMGDWSHASGIDRAAAVEAHGVIYLQVRYLPEALGAARPSRIVSNAIVSGPGEISLTAFHGTPHKVDKFATERVGSGEGNGALGWGLYFGQRPETAAYFRDEISAAHWQEAWLDGRPLTDGEKMGPLGRLMAEKRASLSATFGQARSRALKTAEANGDKETADYLRNFNDGRLGPAGYVYQVEIGASPTELIDHDAPFSEQSPKVKAALQKLIGIPIPPETDFDTLMDVLRTRAKLSPKEVSMRLLEEGVQGVSYLDAQSRAGGGTEPTRNYVIFDESKIKITHENGQPVNPTQRAAVLGTASPQGATSRPFPASHRAVAVAMAEEMATEGVTTPEGMARAISTLAHADKAKPFSQALWNIMGGFLEDEGRETRPDWPKIYAAIAAGKEAPKPSTPSLALADWVEQKIRAGKSFSGQELFDQADTAFQGTQAASKYTSKDAYDALEMGVNRWILSEAHAWRALSPEAAVARLTAMMQKLPTQTKRTAEQDEFQQFSTPPPFSYVAAWAANLRSTDVLAETSAGTGSLAVWGKVWGVKQILLNEFSARRADLLRSMGLGEVTQDNGEIIHAVWPKDWQPTVATINPPFSSTAGRIQGERKTKNGAKHLETLLDRLPEGGRLVAIVGEGMAFDKPHFREWWDRIKARYDVRANIGVNGKNYAKYGTTFSNQIIVIDKVPPRSEVPLSGNVDTIDQLIPLLQKIRDERPLSTQPGKREDIAEGGPAGPPVPSAVPPARPDGAGDLAAGGSGGDVAAPAGGKPTLPGKGGKPAPGRGTTALDSDGGKPASGGGGDAGAVAGSNQGGELAIPEGEAAHIERAETGKEEASDEIFSEYTPQKVAVKGAKPHPTPLVESSSMRAVKAPDPTYKPKIPKSLLESGALSLPQFETTVYAGQAHEAKMANGERAGYFIGDGTGVGKGREISAIIIDNAMQGRKRAIWISEKKGLIQNAQGDFSDLGMPNMEIQDLGKTKSKTGEVKLKHGVLFSTYSTMIGDFKMANVPPEWAVGATVKTAKGEVRTVIRARTVAGVTEMALEAAPGSPAGTGAINAKSTDPGLVSVTPAKGGSLKARVDQIVEWFGKDYDGVIVFDESHNAKNAIAIQGVRGVMQPSSTGLATVELQRRLPNARIVYASATGATEVANLAYADRLGIWGPGTPFSDKSKFFNQISSAGLSAMEIVARDLKALGRYTARTLSFKGVEVGILEHPLSPDQVTMYDTIARRWQDVYARMQEVLASTSADKNSNAKMAARGAFFSSQQRFFNQLLTAIQVPTLIRDMKEKIAAGHSVLIQLTNTNEATLDRALAKASDEESGLEDLDLTPKDILLQYVDKSFPVQLFEEYADDNGNVRSRPVMDAEGKPVLDPAAVEERDRQLVEIRKLAVPENPLEQIINEFGYDKVAEITGRGVRVVKKMVDGTLKTVTESRSEATRKVEAKEFQDDKRQILIFSQAGGTGFSYHSDSRFLNQRRRFHYLLQAGWSADKAIQGLGRGHRSGQVTPPFLQLLRTNLEGHKRFISTIARRLSQLGALTSGERRATSRGLFSEADNLENAYSEHALIGLVKSSFKGEEPAMPWDVFTDKMGFDNMLDGQGALKDDKIPGVPQFLNRVLNLEVTEQGQVFNAFISRMQRSIEFAKEQDTYDPGLQTLKVPRGGKVEILKEEEVYQHPGVDEPTRLVDIQRTTPAEFTDFEKASRMATDAAKDNEKTVLYVRNRRSGKVSILAGAQMRTDRETGTMVRQYNRFGTKSSFVKMDARDVDLSKGSPETPGQPLTKPGNFEELTEAEAKAAWAAEIEAADKFDKEDMTFITGLMLPIWDRIGINNPQVFRVEAGKRSFLGVKVPAKQLDRVRQRLGAARDAVKPADALRMVHTDGATLTLANGWKVVRRRVSGDYRVEVTGMSWGDGDNFKKFMGGFSEKIGFDTRFFIPTDEAGVETMAKLLAQAPIVDSGEALGAASPSGQTAERVQGMAKGRPRSGLDAQRAAQAAAMGAPGGALKAALARTLATAQSIGRFFTQMPPVDDYKAAKGEWLGAGEDQVTGATGRQVAAIEARKLHRVIMKQFPNKLSRMAASRYIEADGNDTMLAQQAAASKGALKEVYQRARALTPEERGLVAEAKAFFDEIGGEAVRLGIMTSMLENYVTHFVDRSSIAEKNRGTAAARVMGDLAFMPSSKLKTNFDQARHRVMESMFELEQEGYRLATSDIADIMAAYSQSFSNTVADRTFVKLLTTLKAADGRPLAVTSGSASILENDTGDGPLMVRPHAKPEEAADYLPIAHPALRKWRWRAQVDGRDVMMEGDIVIHPSIHEDLQNTLGRSALYKVPLVKGITSLQGSAKALMMSFSAFHFVQEGTHALGHTVNPFRLHAVDVDDPVTRELINGGLMLASWDAKAAFGEGLSASGMEKILGMAGLGKLGRLNDRLTAFLFEDYIPGLKVEMAKHALERNLKRWQRQLTAGTLSRAQVVQKTAKQANDAFGEQNNMYEGNNPSYLHAERLAFLAPDFLKSRIRFFADAFTRYGNEQRRALIILALTMMALAKIVERMLTGKNDWRPSKIFSVVTAHREYELRSVPGDVLELVTDWRRFTSGRLSPLVTRPILEALTGRDYRGRKRTMGEELMDLLKTPLPISARGFVDKDAPELSPLEQLGSATGFRARRHSEITDARIMGHEWQKANHLENADEVYPQSKYLSLRNALEDGNLPKAKAAYEALKNTMPKDKVDKGFMQSLMKPFAGSAAHEPKFVASLDADQRKVYQAAVRERAKARSLFISISGYHPGESASKSMFGAPPARAERQPKQILFSGFAPK